MHLRLPEPFTTRTPTPLQHGPDDSNTDNEHQSQHPQRHHDAHGGRHTGRFSGLPTTPGAPSPDSQPRTIHESGASRVRMSLSFRCRAFTPLDHSTKMEVEIETVSSNSDHPSDAQLRHSEDATGSPSTATSRRSATLLSPADVQAPTSRREPHVRQANRQLFRSLHAIYGRSDPLSTHRGGRRRRRRRGRGRLAHPCHGQIPQLVRSR